jgi:hypothetical protein
LSVRHFENAAWSGPAITDAVEDEAVAAVNGWVESPLVEHAAVPAMSAAATASGAAHDGVGSVRFDAHGVEGVGLEFTRWKITNHAA